MLKFFIIHRFHFLVSPMRVQSSVKERLECGRVHCRVVFCRLREQDKRHGAGLLALLIGHGGVSWVADVVGLERDCVSRGKVEVANGLADRPVDRQRLPGAGRKPLEKKVPRPSKPSRLSSPKKPVAHRLASGNLSVRVCVALLIKQVVSLVIPFGDGCGRGVFRCVAM